MTAKKSVADSIQELVKGKTIPAAPHIEKSPESKTKHKGNYKKKGGHGGARQEAGRDPLPAEDKRRSRKQAWKEYGDEEVEVILKENTKAGTVTERRVKMKRLRVVQETIYKKAVGISVAGDMEAAKEFNNRVLGKAPQPIVGDDEEDPIQINHDVTPILEKAYDNEEEKDEG